MTQKITELIVLLYINLISNLISKNNDLNIFYSQKKSFLLSNINSKFSSERPRNLEKL